MRDYKAFADSQSAFVAIKPQLTLVGLLLRVMAGVFIAVAYLWMSASDEAEQERAAQRKQETIAAAKREFAQQQRAAALVGLQDDANHMLAPCCQAHDVGDPVKP